MRIERIADTTQRIVTGNLSDRLPRTGRLDDLDRLSAVVNGMLEQIERLLGEVKGATDGIAHDLRTPLTHLLAGLERTQRRAVTAGDFAVSIDDAIDQTRHILATFSAILRISEVEDGARRAGFRPLDLAAIASDAVEFYEPVAAARGVALCLRTPAAPVPPIPGDASLLFDAIGNLIDNAVKASPAGGTVRVVLEERADGIGLSVADAGPGIPESERAAVLKRFHRLEKHRQTPGSGLGLSLVAAIARLHGMTLVLSDAAPGCRAELTQPWRPAAEPVRTAPRLLV